MGFIDKLVARNRQKVADQGKYLRDWFTTEFDARLKAGGLFEDHLLEDLVNKVIAEQIPLAAMVDMHPIHPKGDEMVERAMREVGKRRGSRP